jgi:predicted branched-subunit amino acid permease
MSSTTASLEPPPPSSAAVYLAGIRAALTSVFSLVLIGTYLGIGALAHDYGFSLFWVFLSTVLLWAGPAQVILISTLGTGGALIEAAIATGVSGVRFLPMVVSLLPLVRGPKTRTADLVVTAHFTAVSVWIESLRLLPAMPREQRLAFCNGMAMGYMIPGQIGTVAGFYLAASLPVLFTAALLFLTPMSFLVSTARNSRMLLDRLALGLGLIVSPILAYGQVGLDLMWTGLIAGTVAYGVHRLRKARS